MRVFLTGGTGFIGKPLTGQLLKRGWQVTALVRNPDSPQARSISQMGAALTKGDITDKESMRSGMIGTDIAINNAGWYEMGVSGNAIKRMFEINVQGADNFLSLAKELNIPRVIHVSSIVYWGNTGKTVRDETWVREIPPVTEYEKSKSQAHDLALNYQKSGLPLIIACPGQVLGANDHSPYGYFLRLYLNGLSPGITWAPEEFISGIALDDLVEGIALCAEKGRIGQTYVLSGEPHTRREFLSIWSSRPGGIRPLFSTPLWLTRLMFATLEPLQRVMGMPAFISRETAASGAIDYYFTSQKAQQELGWIYRPAKQTWEEVIDAELELRRKRKKRDLVSRLKPLNE
ncbi:MAG TPA: NAD-dependent epimerase/dehydratase family protein [Anaerolineales bacterium]|nr:NAD-dependent epimerase/dehydratase family protein [Anaerolineales bacterium]